MEAQQVEAYPAYYTGVEGKLDKVVHGLEQGAGAVVPLRWSWQKVVDDKYSITCETDLFKAPLLAVITADFIERIPADDLVHLLQSEFANKIGKRLVCPNRD